MSTLKTSREIPAKVEEVFAAISDSERLAKWWGPAGFTNTVELCEFKPGGMWKFVMHGPDGTNYPNENTFSEIDAPNKVVITHLSEPHFNLTLELTPTEKGTLVSWAQKFEKAEVAEKLKHICIPANEQNLDKLTDVVLNKN